MLIVNLSKGGIGDDACLLGSPVVTALQQAAMTRRSRPSSPARDVMCLPLCMV
ncbi:MAG: hypothetical protein O3C40_14735 [Planctomycetota bacterium]|nr:hypothetical protein [Planctomycetota bacterium]